MDKLENMKINFDKDSNGLVPAIIQDSVTRAVLMLGYMNAQAYEKTLDTGRVTFFSRSKGRLWTKGEESGNYLELVDVKVDCDSDTLLVTAIPTGPVCHTGTDTCWSQENKSSFGFLSVLEAVIADRKRIAALPEGSSSYVSSLFAKGINKIAQKVGEEAVETVIEAKDNDDSLFLNESADLLFHLLILLQAKGFTLHNVENILKSRHKE